jgi:hypothetical protein
MLVKPNGVENKLLECPESDEAMSMWNGCEGYNAVNVNRQSYGLAWARKRSAVRNRGTARDRYSSR